MILRYSATLLIDVLYTYKLNEKCFRWPFDALNNSDSSSFFLSLVVINQPPKQISPISIKIHNTCIQHTSLKISAFPIKFSLHASKLSRDICIAKYLNMHACMRKLTALFLKNNIYHAYILAFGQTVVYITLQCISEERLRKNISRRCISDI